MSFDKQASEMNKSDFTSQNKEVIFLYIQVIIELDYSLIYPEREERFTHLIERMKVRKWDSISIADIIKLFKNKGILFDSHMFLYFSNSQQIYIYCGSTFDPIT